MTCARSWRKSQQSQPHGLSQRSRSQRNDDKSSRPRQGVAAMTIQVRRGDTRTLTMTELAAQAGVTLGNFQAGDVVEFSLRTRLSDSAATIDKTSASGGVTD